MNLALFQSETTPMMQQYFSIKSQYPDALLFYRLGDFYEMFYDDAKIASQILELTLTTRNKNSNDPVPMCGVPHHASDGYIAKLVRHGKKVVVCDQVSDPKQSKGLVERQVVRVLTPGTVLEEETLKAKCPNYMASLVLEADLKYTLVLCDVSTGQVEYRTGLDESSLLNELQNPWIRECIFKQNLKDQTSVMNPLLELKNIYLALQSDLYFDFDFAAHQILTYYQVHDLKALGLNHKAATQALGALLNYLGENKVLKPNLLNPPKLLEDFPFLKLSDTTLTHLEIFKTQAQDQTHGSLFWHLDRCQTSMGSRRLTELLRRPFYDIDTIERRQKAIEELKENNNRFEALERHLSRVSDVHRIINRFISGKATAREALALKESLLSLEQIKVELQSTYTPVLEELKADLLDFSDLKDQIERTLLPEPPRTLKEGGLIQEGVHPELDELRQIEKNGKDTILKIESKEKERTGITSLKIRFNNVFGYYIEVTHTHKDKVPADYIRKQTLTQAERYITEELKIYESKVLGASDRINALEHEIFLQLRDQIIQKAAELKKMAQALAELDVFCALTDVSKTYAYVKPTLSLQPVLDLKAARHPILENLMKGESFVPSDISLNQNPLSQYIITGPNMAGKSTLMRMTALIVLMAQLGSEVPCVEATVGLCDQIFTRVGAHDSLQKGLSTFMVEMLETAQILRQATPLSLVILDEVGRGTSTFDGLSLAWAIAEDLHDRLKVRTLFATHYHELCDLAQFKEGIANAHLEVKEYKDQLVFMRKLVPGATHRSLGLAVAKMAGLPQPVVLRAKSILKLLEEKDLSFQNQMAPQGLHSISHKTPEEDSPLVLELKALNLNQLTPLEALLTLAHLQKHVL